MNRTITICGGGPAGLACGIILRILNFEVEIYEKQNYGRLSLDDSKNFDDVQVLVLNNNDISLLQEILGITLTPVEHIFTILKGKEYKLDQKGFYLVRKGYSPHSINYELYKRALELGIKFIFAPLNPYKKINGNLIQATGSMSHNVDYTINGWRYILDESIDNRTVLIDFHPITNEYSYIARLDDRFSCILLSREPICHGVALSYFENHLRKFLPRSSLVSLNPFRFRMPKNINDPHQSFKIGTSRGINDSLFFFGLAESLVDGMNLAFSITTPGYNVNEFVSNKKQKNNILSFVNFVKETSCKFGLKEKYITTFLSNKVLLNFVRNLVTTTITPQLRTNLESLSHGSQRSSTLLQLALKQPGLCNSVCEESF